MTDKISPIEQIRAKHEGRQPIADRALDALGSNPDRYEVKSVLDSAAKVEEAEATNLQALASLKLTTEDAQNRAHTTQLHRENLRADRRHATLYYRSLAAAAQLVGKGWAIHLVWATSIVLTTWIVCSVALPIIYGK